MSPVRTTHPPKARCAAYWLLAASWCVLACSGPPEDERNEIHLPPYEGFAPVGLVLHSHCGSLDCHGDIARNLRLYGQNGLRLNPKEVPGGSLTTDAELRANYVSVVALEPEMLSLVVAEQGAKPDRLTLIRKGRGTEHHKGGEAMEAGGDADRCVVSWLASKLDETECMKAAELLRPDEMPAATPAPMPTP